MVTVQFCLNFISFLFPTESLKVILGSLVKSILYCVPCLSFFSSWQPCMLISKEHATEFDSEVDIADLLICNYKNGCVIPICVNLYFITFVPNSDMLWNQLKLFFLRVFFLFIIRVQRIITHIGACISKLARSIITFLAIPTSKNYRCRSTYQTKKQRINPTIHYACCTIVPLWNGHLIKIRLRLYDFENILLSAVCQTVK